MLPESLCPKVEYVVSFLEYIDIEKSEFKVPQEKCIDIMLPNAKYNQKCMVKASMPRLGFTRGNNKNSNIKKRTNPKLIGDIVPLKVTVDHFTSFIHKDGVTVELVRTVEIRTTRHTVFKETILKTTPYPVDIKAPNYSQSIICQIAIPTSTPPSIRYKDKVLRFHYKVRVSVLFGKRNIYSLDLPIVVGTWPRAAVPIEDDDDAFAQDIEDSVLTDEEEDIESLGTSSIDEFRTNSGILPSWHTNISSTSALTLPANKGNSNGENTLVGRSDSKASNKSFNSFKSTRSWEYNNQPNNLSRNTSQSTTLSSPARLPSYYSDSLYPNINMNRNSHQRQQRSRYDNNHSPIQLESDVPTHILEPLPSHFIPLTSPIHEQQEPENIYFPCIQQEASSSSEDDSDDDDLLAIIKRKEKKEKRQLKQTAL